SGGGAEAGAAVSLMSGGETLQMVLSGADGGFTFDMNVLLARDNAPATYVIKATKTINGELWSGSAEAHLTECGAMAGGSPILAPPPPPPATGSVTGKVIDSESGEPISGATVYVGIRNAGT